MKQCRVLLLSLICLGIPAALHAQNGCLNSPENGTAILALVGVAGGAMSAWRARKRL